MSENLLAGLNVNQYASNIELLLQQKGSKLLPYIMTGSHKGKQAAVVDQLGAGEALEVTDRFAPIPRIDVATDRRWVVPRDFQYPALIDNFDKLRLIVEPDSAEVQNAAFALGRKQDDEIIRAFFGTAKTGVDGTTSTTFGAANGSQSVSVLQGATSATNLTVAKLREARRILMANEVDVDSEPLTCVVTSKQHDSLLAEAQVINLDYNDKPVLVEGKITRFLGINFIHCERLTTASDDQTTTSRQVPLFAKSGMYFGQWNGITTDVSVRNDLVSLPWQVYAKATFGATRLEEKKIVRIWCRES